MLISAFVGACKRIKELVDKRLRVITRRQEPAVLWLSKLESQASMKNSIHHVISFLFRFMTVIASPIIRSDYAACEVLSANASGGCGWHAQRVQYNLNPEACAEATVPVG